MSEIVKIETEYDYVSNDVIEEGYDRIFMLPDNDNTICTRA